MVKQATTTAPVAEHVQHVNSRVALIRRTYCAEHSDDEFALFMLMVDRTGLSPESRQIYTVARWDNRAGCYKWSTLVSIDGSRAVAERSEKYAGQQGPWYCGKDGVWKDVWCGEGFPFAAKVAVLRHDFAAPMEAIAYWESYVGRDKGGKVTHMWSKFPELMLAKCAEALALRKAFPMHLSGLYTPEEMDQTTHSDAESNKTVQKLSAMVEAPAKVAPKVEAPAAVLHEDVSRPPMVVELTETHKAMLHAFAAFNVTMQDIENHVGVAFIDFGPEQFGKCRAYYELIKQENSRENTSSGSTLEKLKSKFAPVQVQ